MTIESFNLGTAISDLREGADRSSPSSPVQVDQFIARSKHSKIGRDKHQNDSKLFSITELLSNCHKLILQNDRPVVLSSCCLTPALPKI